MNRGTEAKSSVMAGPGAGREGQVEREKQVMREVGPRSVRGGLAGHFKGLGSPPLCPVALLLLSG